MTQSFAHAIPDPDPSQDRQARILDAAERCFVRSGFHRTTMQDVAVEASMSPGNLYRYFRSKDAIVMALTERDRARIGEDFATFAQSDDFVGIFRQLARRHFAEEPRERSILCLEIWAEATRNRSFAAISEAFEDDIHGRMAALFRDAQEKGLIDAGVDPSSLAHLVSTLADGLFVRRAISPRFDPEREVGNMVAVMEAAFAGKIDLIKADDAAESRREAR
jgi:TetR/AcrR family transcriptional regulator, repressor for uid operon